jgi:hypothetical protein
MAEVAQVLFVGGRCAGQTQTRLLSDLEDGTVACNAQLYKSYQVAGGGWLALLPSAHPPHTITAGAPQAMKAWHDLIRDLAVTVPRELARSRQARQRMLRLRP